MHYQNKQTANGLGSSQDCLLDKTADEMELNKKCNWTRTCALFISSYNFSRLRQGCNVTSYKIYLVMIRPSVIRCCTSHRDVKYYQNIRKPILHCWRKFYNFKKESKVVSFVANDQKWPYSIILYIWWPSMSINNCGLSIILDVSITKYS